MHFGKIDMLPSFLLWRIGPLLVPKPLLAIQIARGLTNTGEGDGRRRWKYVANIRHDSLRDSCNNCQRGNMSRREISDLRATLHIAFFILLGLN